MIAFALRVPRARNRSYQWSGRVSCRGLVSILVAAAPLAVGQLGAGASRFVAGVRTALISSFQPGKGTRSGLFGRRVGQARLCSIKHFS